MLKGTENGKHWEVLELIYKVNITRLNCLLDLGFVTYGL